MDVNRDAANRSAPVLPLRRGDRAELSTWLQSSAVPSNVVRRAQIVLLASQGASNTEIAETLGVSRPTVIGWRRRYQDRGITGLTDEHRPGRPRQIDHASIVAATLRPPPSELGIAHWSTRLLAAQLNISDATVGKAWREYGIMPWRAESFRFSTGPALEATVVDIVGLYLAPPDDAVMLAVDEPWRKPDSVTTDRPGSGVNAYPEPRRAQPELPAFVDELSHNYPDSDLHLVMDDHRTPDHAQPRGRSARHPCVTSHSTATHSLWLNLLDVWSAMAAERHPGHDDVASIPDLDSGLRTLIDGWHRQGPFVWTKAENKSSLIVTE